MNSPVDTFVAPPCSASIDILHVDGDFLLINKPSGLLSLSGKNPLNRDAVHFRLQQYYPSATLVHSQYNGHSILGCDLYGSTQTQAMSEPQHSLVFSSDRSLGGHVNQAIWRNPK